MRKFAGFTAALLSTAIVAPVFASDDEYCGDAARDEWMTEDAVRVRVGELGYDIQRLETDDGCYEAYARDDEGRRLKIKIHPVTGDVVRTKEDD